MTNLKLNDTVRLISPTNASFDSGRIGRIDYHSGVVYVRYSGQDFGTETTAENLELIDVDAERKQQALEQLEKRRADLVKMEARLELATNEKERAVLTTKVERRRRLLGYVGQPPALD